MNVQIPEAGQPVDSQTFTFTLRKDKLRQIRRREGRYLLRTNLTAGNPEELWKQYIVLTEVEQAFKDFIASDTFKKVTNWGALNILSGRTQHTTYKHD